jgi:3-hydroxyacyl-[acyl-carrier-protein] dehydratase
MEEQSVTFGLDEIQKILPHRAPMLLVDGVTSLLPGVSIRAFRDFKADEVIFQGHFPNRPILPGVLAVEAIAQAACILAGRSIERDIVNASDKLPCLLSIMEARFRRPVFPGDRLESTVEVVHAREDVWKLRGRAHVGDVLVVEVVLMATAVSFRQFDNLLQSACER